MGILETPSAHSSTADSFTKLHESNRLTSFVFRIKRCTHHTIELKQGQRLHDGSREENKREKKVERGLPGENTSTKGLSDLQGALELKYDRAVLGFWPTQCWCHSRKSFPGKETFFFFLKTLKSEDLVPDQAPGPNRPSWWKDKIWMVRKGPDNG